MKPEVSVIVPLFNEELVIGEMHKRLTIVLEKASIDFEIILVNDGSKDNTLKLAKDICDSDKRAKLISFSRNFGHQMAITAGMDKCNGHAIIVIDADLQDPPEVIFEMIKKWRAGYQVVYGIREKRIGENLFKRFTAAAFYRMLRRLTTVDIPVDAGDFRLIDRRVLKELVSMRERDRFVRGMISWIGFKQGEVRYIRQERLAGETKYPLRKMLIFAIDGILSFSKVPLQLASILGFLSSVISFFYMVYGMVIKIFFPYLAIPGWASIFSAVLFLGGVQLIGLGILGEYIGRIYEEIKQRPLYIIDEEINF